MADKLIDEIQELQANIEKEKDDELTCLLKSFSASLKSKDNDSYFETEKPNFDLAILVWLCLKIELEFQALRAGNIELEVPLRSDISSAFEYVQKCEHKWKMSRDVIADTIDLLLSIGTVKENELQKYGSKYVTSLMRTQKEVSEDMYYLFSSTARQLLSIGKEMVAYHLIERLCILSRERNNKERHKELVVNAFSVIFDGASSIICRIASVNEKEFAGDCSELAGDFYWFYACCLWKEENASAASIYFDTCYSIRKALYGQDHWLTALAKRHLSVINYGLGNDYASHDYLVQFIWGIETERFEIDVAKSVVKEIEAETLYVLLSKQFASIPDLSEYKELTEIYMRICNEYSETTNSRISKRLAWNYKGNYYLQSGEYILAEDAFQHALRETADKAEDSILNDDQIRTNLLVIANVQNDTCSMASVLEKLSDGDADLSDTDYLRIYTTVIGNYMQSGVVMDDDEFNEVKELAQDLCESIVAQDESIEEIRVAAAMFIYAVVVYILQNPVADVSEQKLYLEALICVEKDVFTYRLSSAQRYMLIQAEGLLAWNLGLPETEKYINKSLNGAEYNRLPLINKASINHTAAAFFGKKGQHNTAIFCAGKTMSYLTEIWHSYVKYANDTRLVNILLPIQNQFIGCYAIVRQYADVENAYERVLQFKVLASLAGRERNRISHASTMDSDLIKKINAIQDRLAILETEEIFQERAIEYEELEGKLRKYESKFAMTFPENIAFKEISWNLVENAIPDDSVILEYFLTVNDFGQTQFEVYTNEDELEVFDLYFVRKRNGKTSLKRYIINDAVAVKEKAEQFIAIYQEKSTNAGISENEDSLEDLRYDLYEALIKPVIDEISENATIFFAPDSSLVNLPFELLYEDESLEESHQIMKIECARDFLFSSPNVLSTKGGLVIGNPEYSVRANDIILEEERSFDQTRAIGIDLMEIGQLPFAEIEVDRVADYFASFPLTGKAATKEKFLSADGCSNLHIATHGFFDLSGETEAIYSSCLMFAGVKNWMQSSAISKEYGNGIVTADEISRLDLKSTKLVVLSSCLNGRSEMIISKGFQGMIGAFAAAGVKYVIAHLWNVPDSIGTVILMDTFYYCYIEEKMSPPLALAKAKEYLKTLTIDKMRKQGWFEYVQNSNLDFTSKKSVTMLEKCNGKLRPFKDEMFWGGFSCYRCN